MKERFIDLMKRLKPKHTQNYDISKWVTMRYYAPFPIDEKLLEMI